MAHHAHYSYNLTGGDETSLSAMIYQVGTEPMLFCLEYGRLVKTDCGGMYVHVEENDIRITNTQR